MANLKLKSASAEFGKATKAKLSNVTAPGEPEDQLRTPVERLVGNLAKGQKPKCFGGAEKGR